VRRSAQEKDPAQAFCAASFGCFDDWFAAVTLTTHASKFFCASGWFDGIGVLGCGRSRILRG
jgi:hypothetical protein